MTAPIAALTFSRFAGNVGYRFLFPFLPATSRGLGISLVEAGAALSLRDLAGLIAPAAGRLADAVDRRHLLTAAAAMTGVTLTIAGTSRGFLAFAVSLFVVNSAKLTHDITMGAWIGDRVRFAERGRVIGLTESSWAIAQLCGIPLIGLAIDQFGWRAGFFGAAALNLIASLLLPAALAPEDRRRSSERTPLRIPRSMWGLLLGNSLLGFGMQLIFVTYGSWLEDDHGLSIAALGLTAMGFGVAELGGSGLMTLLSDRLGKRRSVIFGLCPMAVFLFVLGFTGQQTAVALAVMCALLFAFEFTIVSAIPLLTEMDSESRATGLGVSLAFQTVARAAGSFAGAALYTQGGMRLSSAVACGFIVLTLVTFQFAVGEPAGDSDAPPDGTDDVGRSPAPGITDSLGIPDPPNSSQGLASGS